MTEYRNQISLGNVIQVAVIMVMVAVAYSVVDSRSTANTDSIKALTNNMSAIDARVRLIEVNDARAAEKFTNILELLASNDARASEKFTNILENLSRIDSRLARIEQSEAKR